jgi:hypothetical protein
LCYSYFVAGVVVDFLVVVVFVDVVFLSELLQPVNVKAASTRTADSVKITFFMIIPLRHIVPLYIWLMFERVRTPNTHQTTITGPEKDLKNTHHRHAVEKNQERIAGKMSQLQASGQITGGLAG